MNKHQIKGAIREATGEIKEQVGKATGNESLRERGHAQEQAGKLQKKGGDLKETLRDSARRHDRTLRDDEL